MSSVVRKDDPGRPVGRSSYANGNSICSVRYYSPRTARLAIIVTGKSVRIREEKTIVAKNEAGYVDLRRAAELLGINQRAVRNLVSRRRLETEWEGEGAAARLVVSLASVERLRLERQAAGKD